MSEAHPVTEPVTADRHPRPLRRLVRYVLAEPGALARLVLAGVAYHALKIVAAGLGAWILAAAVTGRPPAEIEPVVWWAAAAAAGAAVAEWWQQNVGHDWAVRMLRELRIKVFDGLERATPGRILGRRTGDLVSVAMADVNATENFFAHTAGDYLAAVLLSLASLVLLAAIDAPVALVAAALMVAIAVVPAVLARQAGEYGARLRGHLGTLNAEVVDGVQGLRELTVFRHGPAYLRRLLERTDNLRRYQRAQANRSAAEHVAAEALLTLGVAATLLVGAAQVGAGTLEAVWLPVIPVLLVAATGPIAEVSATARELGDIRAAAARILAIVEYPTQVPDTGTLTAPERPRPTVRFRGVRFAYSPDRPEVLRGVDFAVAPGETVALVGRSGAGKSTCANLLLRFWDATGGRIEVGGHDVRAWPLAALRDLVTLVPQDIYLFNTSVRENIRLARPDVTDEEVEQAARQAVAHEFVTALPDGYDTQVGERGAFLSGGQRQRIGIARALLKRAPVIVMDEAVSNLDAESEEALARALAGIRAERTILLIAHRLSTIRSADRVVMLDGGRVVADGRHEELLVASEPYRELLANQRGGLVDA